MLITIFKAYVADMHGYGDFVHSNDVLSDI